MPKSVQVNMVQMLYYKVREVILREVTYATAGKIEWHIRNSESYWSKQLVNMVSEAMQDEQAG